MFTLCIPTMDRFDDFLSEYLPQYINNELISEIIISDENGNDIDKINKLFKSDKLKLFKNEKKLGPFLNKINACSKSSNEWIALIDSDNFADNDYFVTAKKYLEKNITNEKNIILAPCWAKPNFNYSHMSNFIYKNGSFNLNKLKELNNNSKNQPGSEVLMNTGNYIINKYLIEKINLTNEQNNIAYSSACDVIYFNTLLFEQLDLNLHVVPNLSYLHVVHNKSIYLQTNQKFAQFNDIIYNRFRNLQ